MKRTINVLPRTDIAPLDVRLNGRMVALDQIRTVDKGRLLKRAGFIWPSVILPMVGLVVFACASSNGVSSGAARHGTRRVGVWAPGIT